MGAALLAPVYADLYYNDHSIQKFNKDLFDVIHKTTCYKVDHEKRTIELYHGSDYVIHDIEWVLNNEFIDNNSIKRIDA